VHDDVFLSSSYILLRCFNSHRPCYARDYMRAADKNLVAIPFLFITVTSTRGFCKAHSRALPALLARPHRHNFELLHRKRHTVTKKQEHLLHSQTGPRTSFIHKRALARTSGACGRSASAIAEPPANFCAKEEEHGRQYPPLLPSKATPPLLTDGKLKTTPTDACPHRGGVLRLSELRAVLPAQGRRFLPIPARHVEVWNSNRVLRAWAQDIDGTIDG